MEQIISESIKSFNEYIKRIPNGCMVIADLFRKDQVAVGLENVANFADGMMWIIEVTELLKQNEIKLVLNVAQVQEFLVEINQAIEVQDYNLLADLFEYELARFFESVQPIAVS